MRLRFVLLTGLIDADHPGEDGPSFVLDGAFQEHVGTRVRAAMTHEIPVVEDLVLFTEVGANDVRRRTPPCEANIEMQAGHPPAEAHFTEPEERIVPDLGTKRTDRPNPVANVLYDAQRDTGAIPDVDGELGHDERVDVGCRTEVHDNGDVRVFLCGDDDTGEACRATQACLDIDSDHRWCNDAAGRMNEHAVTTEGGSGGLEYICVGRDLGSAESGLYRVRVFDGRPRE